MSDAELPESCQRFSQCSWKSDAIPGCQNLRGKWTCYTIGEGIIPQRPQRIRGDDGDIVEAGFPEASLGYIWVFIEDPIDLEHQ